MSFRMETKVNGKFENKSPNFKAMDLGEEVTVTVLELIKEGTASKEGRSWNWYLFKMQINGEDCAGFAPTGKVAELFLENVGGEVVITKTTYRDRNNNEKIGFDCKAVSSPFQFNTSDLKDEEGTYPDVDAIKMLKDTGDGDNLEQYKKMWVKYGSTAERAELVFKNRGKTK